MSSSGWRRGATSCGSPVRDPEAALFLKPMGAVGQIVPLYAPLQHEADVHRAVDGADLVVNLVGILAERRAGDFQRIHAEGAGAWRGWRRRPAWRGWCRSRRSVPIRPARAAMAPARAAGELAVRAAFPAATILRPSLVFGPEDQLFNRFATMAQRLPLMPVIAGATRFQPVYVGDVADAVMAGVDPVRCALAPRMNWAARWC